MAGLSVARVWPQLSTAAPVPLPAPRRGPRPTTRLWLPHIQLDQWPPPELVEQLFAEAKRLPHVGVRQSRMASPETPALCLQDRFAGGPNEAFIDGPEFCHLHPPPEGGAHLTLPPAIGSEVAGLGWVEKHPLAPSIPRWKCLVLVYAPRDETELKIVMDLLETSWAFARGPCSGLR